MSPRGTIDADRLWKRFRADRKGTYLGEELRDIVRKVRRRPTSRWRWALRDLSLKIDPGESVGLVGVNGSGKSTLLKLLCRVMYPYAGRLEIAGRVGALIEVRSGIHPDLTGRENIFLYGSLLGLKRREISKRFDDIIGFAEIESAIDRQVKFYSSGMQMRLGFGVAAYLEPDILLVDEVLAVGDSSFQQRCMERMKTVLSQGTTIVFVSHDLAAVEAISKRGVWLDNGVILEDGPIGDVLHGYRMAIEERAESLDYTAGVVALKKVDLQSPSGGEAESGGPAEISLVLQSPTYYSTYVCLGVSEGPATPIFVVSRAVDVNEGETEVRCLIDHLPLPRGRFYLWLSVLNRMTEDLLPWQPVAPFTVAGQGLDGLPTGVMRLAPVQVSTHWQSQAR